MKELQKVVVETNQKVANILGINPSAATTCVKPSGNSSQLLNCSPGIHARWSPYYIRNVRVGAHTPVYKVLENSGVPMDPENGQTKENANTYVVHFPVKSPEKSITRDDRTALEQGFNAHNERVKAVIPADRLLVFDVRQGWQPLCAFLGVAVPDTPFPRTNDRAEFWDRVSGTS